MVRILPQVNVDIGALYHDRWTCTGEQNEALAHYLAHDLYRCFLCAREGIMAGFLARMLRASLLDPALYEEVEADTRATWQAVGVVCLSSLASGLGSGARDGVPGVIVHTLVVLIAWYAWAYLSYFIGTTVLPEAQTRANHGELLRTLGFSSAPGILRLLGLIPGLTVVVFILVYGWMLVAMVVAVRQALDYTSTVRAFAVCILGGLIILGLIVLVASPLVGGVS
jgi:hypothetical protein